MLFLIFFANVEATVETVTAASLTNGSNTAGFMLLTVMPPTLNSAEKAAFSSISIPTSAKERVSVPVAVFRAQVVVSPATEPTTAAATTPTPVAASAPLTAPLIADPIYSC